MTTARVIMMMAVTGLVVGCSSFSNKSRGSDPQYFATGQHQIAVTQNERSLPIHFDDGQSSLAPHVLAPVASFVDDFIDQGGGTLYLEVSAGQSEEQIAGQLSYLGAELRKRGVRAKEMVVRPAGAGSDADVTLVYGKYSASVPGCPDWSEPFVDFHKNVAHSNFGCSSRKNFVKMLANPRDAVQPRDFSNGDGDQASRAISGMRSGEQEPMTTSSSEVGDEE